MIKKEYLRYLYVQDILNLERSPLYYSAVCETLYCMSLFSKNKKINNFADEVFADVPTSHVFYSPIFKLLNQGFSHDDVLILITNIQKKIKNFLSINASQYPEVKYGITETTYFCGDLVFEFNNMLHKYLTSKASAEKIILCWLRYKCVPYLNAHFSFGQNIKLGTFLKKNKMGEALNTPFSANQTNDNYFSLFDDTDICFGSKGNIFNNNNISDCLFIVPPICIVANYVLRYIIDNKLNKYILIFQTDNTVLHNCLCKKLFINNKKIKNVRNSDYGVHITVEDNFNSKLSMDYVLPDKYKMITCGVYSSDFTSYIKKNSRNIIKSNPIIDRLEHEYLRFKFVDELSFMLTGNEWLNILERFLISMSNIQRESKNDVILLDLPIDHNIYIKLKEELIEKKIYYSGDIRLRIKNKILAFINSLTNTRNRTLVYGRLNNTFYCGRFKKTIDDQRKNALLNLSNEYYVEKILIIMLRYESLLPRGQNWNLPYKWYYNINKIFGITLEGYSNPLNSQMLIAQKNSNFCSLFKDTDEQFGSLGNLFSLDIVKFYEEKKDKSKDGIITISLNPPYILSLMLDTILLIKKWLSHNIKLRVFVGFPYWENVKEIRDFELYKHVKKQKIFGIGEYYYENSMDHNIPKIFHDKYQLFYIENFKGPIDEFVFNEMTPLFDTK